MRTNKYVAGLAVAGGAAALVLPLSIAPALAAPTADLSITKTVASAALPIDFDPALRDVRSTSSDDWTRDGLHIKTQGWESTDKVGEYVASSTPLADAGEPSLEYTTLSGPIPPGFVLKVDIDGDSTPDGELFGESAYGNDWWLNFPSSIPANAAFKLAAPSCDGSPIVATDDEGAILAAGACEGGSGSVWHGTLNQWRGALPPGATVTAWGFSLGSGVQGEGIVTGLTFAGTHHDLVRRYASSIQAAPGEKVEYKLTVANSGSATADASGIHLTDVLPADLTYVANSLEDSGWCSFSSNTLTCNAGFLPVNTSATIYFKATISSDVSSVGYPSTVGHNVDVQKQEVFADLPAGTTRTYTAMCPAGFLPTDGGLLVDSVDQDGFYSDVVVSSSTAVTQSGVKGWSVTTTNFGDTRAQGKVKVTCLDETIGSANGHTHAIDVSPSTLVSNPLSSPAPADSTASGATIERDCPAGYLPVGPEFDVAAGAVAVRASFASGSTWLWVADYSAGAKASFDVSCLAPETSPTGGHTASLVLTNSSGTVSVGPEGRAEGVQQCPSNGHGIVGGYGGTTADVLSLGREQRGNNYMFRFYNQDWSAAHNATIQVLCVGVRTPDEPTFYHVTNTAHVTTTTPDLTTSNDTSSADISIVGDVVAADGAPMVRGTGTRNTSGGDTTAVVLKITCGEPCTFAVKVLKNGNVVAKATKSLAGNPLVQTVTVPTTGQGKNLGSGAVSVKVKPLSGATTFTPVTLS